LSLDEERLKRVFYDPDTVKRKYQDMFLQIRMDMEIQNPNITKIYVERIDVMREGNIISYRVQYGYDREQLFIIGTVKSDSSAMNESTTF